MIPRVSYDLWNDELSVVTMFPFFNVGKRWSFRHKFIIDVLQFLSNKIDAISLLFKYPEIT